MSIASILAWAKAKWLPSGQVDLPISTVKRIAWVVQLLAYLSIPFYQLDLALRKKYKRSLVSVSTTRSDLTLLAAKYMGLLAQHKELQDEHGFIMSDTGDSLLFSGLAGAAGVPMDITAARNDQGQWFRRPIDNPVVASSTISRDMLIGLLWYCWRNKRLDVLEALWTYGAANDWVMGTGDASRICMLPALVGTLALMIAKLGGKKHLARYNPQLWSTAGVVDYEAHLQVLHIALMGEVNGEVDGSMMSALQFQANREDENPLFTATLARYTGSQVMMAKAENSLDNDHWWPTDRLPREDDRSEPWLPQRDLGADWGTGKGTRQWTGCDLIFCLSI